MKDFARSAAATALMVAGLAYVGLVTADEAQAQPGPFPQWCPGDTWDPGWGPNSDWNRCHNNPVLPLPGPNVPGHHLGDHGGHGRPGDPAGPGHPGGPGGPGGGAPGGPGGPGGGPGGGPPGGPGGPGGGPGAGAPGGPGGPGGGP